MGQKTN